MNDRIKSKLKMLPTKSGVYVMKNAGGAVIYVGKAKSLKNRVSQYFRNSPKASKVQAMVDNIDDFDYFITVSERDALALESNLIKKYQPHYNILLKDGKAFPYIAINMNDPFPKLQILRKVGKKGYKYFGPYFAGLNAAEIVKTANSAFGLRTCNQKITETSVAKRECLNFFLGLCSAPCTKRVNKAEYAERVKKVINFLNGNDDEIENILTQKMQQAAENENFESALIYRDRLKMVAKLKQRVVANLPKSVNKDVFAYVTDGLNGVITSMVIRGGKILGVMNYPCDDASLEEGQTLFNFLVQYYENMIVPDEMIVSHVVEDENLLFGAIGKKSKIISNPHGINLSLLNMAKENAKDYLEKHIEKNKIKYASTLGALEKLQQALNLPRFPNRMECYDISHISGTNKVASMVVFKGGEPSKKDYRKFKIKTVQGSNDFASLQEALRRRLRRFKDQDGESFKEVPDLLIIDGGKGQLSSCQEILQQSGLDIPMISLAKRIEEVFVPHQSQPILLKPGSAQLKLLQRIRDEAHRFAITFHRQTRTKMQSHSELEEINGLGAKKAAALLNAFGSIDQIKNASVDELKIVPGIHEALAIEIKKHFQNKKER